MRTFPALPVLPSISLTTPNLLRGGFQAAHQRGKLAKLPYSIIYAAEIMNKCSGSKHINRDFIIHYIRNAFSQMVVIPIIHFIIPQ